MEAEEREQQAEHCNEDDWVDTDGNEEEAGSLGHNEAVANGAGQPKQPYPDSHSATHTIRAARKDFNGMQSSKFSQRK
jgi:hypothetical protein